MNCPECRQDNPAGARFCLNCGRPLPGACANCGTVLPAAARFCFNCGRAQGESPPPAPVIPPEPTPESLLERFISPELIDKVKAARGESERRIVTMLFCDVKGSTAAAGKLDPEEWVEIINGAFECMIQPVYQYEGMVARLMGDGLLAFFGAPVAHEDDPQRAVLAGLDILERIRVYREPVRRRWDVDIDVRIGINTGVVVVGAVGSDLKLEYTAIGDAINLAARMEQTAEPGTVQVAEDTHRLIAPLFEFQPLGEIPVKGKEHPVRAYRVVGRKLRPGKLRGISGLDSPMVGREREISVLEGYLDDLGRGQGGIVFIVGEAGLGKSRLIAESRRLLELHVPAFEWYESASLSYEVTLPYGLFQRLFRRLYGVTASDNQTKIKDRLAVEIADLYGRADRHSDPDEIQSALSVLDRMLAGKATAESSLLEGESFQTRLRQVMTDVWRHRSSRRPTVLVFDDLHWSDVASVDLLSHLFTLVDESPILFLCALRPEESAMAGKMMTGARERFRSRQSVIALSSLSPDESGELVTGLFRQIDWPPELRRRVLDKAGGNPFFVEEIIRSLLEAEVIIQTDDNRWVVKQAVAEIELPDTLQGLLLARIDRLAEETRHTLQLASVIGRSFYFQVLAALSDAVTSLDRHIGELLTADLVREAASLPDLEYVFTHALTQQAAYSSILRKRRLEFHRRVGEVMEQLFSPRRDEMSPILALHFDRAREWDRAIRYYSRAGDLAFDLYANAEAAAHYRRALDILPDTMTSDVAFVDHLFRRLGRTLELMARYREALAVYEEMEQWGRTNNEPPIMMASLLGRATIRSTANAYNDPALALAHLEQAKGLSVTMGDQAVEARILWNLMLLSSMNSGSIPGRRSYVEEALAVARQAGLREQEAFILFDSWYYFGAVGEWRTAEKQLLEALGLWRELGNMPLLAETYARLKYSTWYLGEYDRALAYAAEGVRFAQLSRNVEAQAISLSGAGAIHVDRGELQRGLDVMEEAVRLGYEAEVVTTVGGTQADMGWVYGWLGLPAEKGLPLAERAAVWLEEHMAQVAGFALAPLARLYLLVGQVEKAKEVLAKLGSFQQQQQRVGFVASVWVQTGLAEIELALLEDRVMAGLTTAEALQTAIEKSGVRYLRADVYLIAAKALYRLGRYEEAAASVAAAEAVARAIGSRRILWEVLLLRANSALRFDGTSGDEDLREAATIVADMVGTLNSEKLRATFQRTAAKRQTQLAFELRTTQSEQEI